MSLLQRAAKLLGTGLNLGGSSQQDNAMRALQSLITAVRRGDDPPLEALNIVMRSPVTRSVLSDSEVTQKVARRWYDLLRSQNAEWADTYMATYPNKFGTRAVNIRLNELRKNDPDGATRFQERLFDSDGKRRGGNNSAVREGLMGDTDPTPVSESAGDTPSTIIERDGRRVEPKIISGAMNVQSELPGNGPKTDMGNALDDAGIETGSTGIPRQIPQTPERRLNTQPLNKTVSEALGEDTNIRMTNKKNFLSGAEMLPEATDSTPNWVVAMFQNKLGLPGAENAPLLQEFKRRYRQIIEQFSDIALDEGIDYDDVMYAMSLNNTDDMPEQSRLIRNAFLEYAKQLPPETLGQSTPGATSRIIYPQIREENAAAAANANLEPGKGNWQGDSAIPAGDARKMNNLRSSISAAGMNPSAADGTMELSKRFSGEGMTDDELLMLLKDADRTGLSSNRPGRLGTESKAQGAASYQVENWLSKTDDRSLTQLYEAVGLDNDMGHRAAWQMATGLVDRMFRTGGDFKSPLSRIQAIEGVARSLRGRFGLDFDLYRGVPESTRTKIFKTVDEINAKGMGGTMGDTVNPVRPQTYVTEAGSMSSTKSVPELAAEIEDVTGIPLDMGSMPEADIRALHSQLVGFESDNIYADMMEELVAAGWEPYSLQRMSRGELRRFYNSTRGTVDGAGQGARAGDLQGNPNEFVSLRDDGALDTTDNPANQIAEDVIAPKVTEAPEVTEVKKAIDETPQDPSDLVPDLTAGDNRRIDELVEAGLLTEEEAAGMSSPEIREMYREWRILGRKKKPVDTQDGSDLIPDLTEGDNRRIDEMVEAGILTEEDAAGMTKQEIRDLYRQSRLAGNAEKSLPVDEKPTQPEPVQVEPTPEKEVNEGPAIELDDPAPTLDPERIATKRDLLDEMGIDHSDMDNDQVRDFFNRLQLENQARKRAEAERLAEEALEEQLQADDFVRDEELPTPEGVLQREEQLEEFGNMITDDMTDEEVLDTYMQMVRDRKQMELNRDNVVPDEEMPSSSQRGKPDPVLAQEGYGSPRGKATIDELRDFLEDNGIDTSGMDDAEIPLEAGDLIGQMRLRYKKTKVQPNGSTNAQARRAAAQKVNAANNGAGQTQTQSATPGVGARSRWNPNINPTPSATPPKPDRGLLSRMAWSRSGNPYKDYALNYGVRVGVPVLGASYLISGGPDEAQQVTDEDGRVYNTGRGRPRRARKLGDLDAPYVAMQERIRRLRQQQ